MTGRAGGGTAAGGAVVRVPRPGRAAVGGAPSPDGGPDAASSTGVLPRLRPVPTDPDTDDAAGPSQPDPRGPATRSGRVAERVHHHAVFQEDVAPVESYGVLPSAVVTAAAIVVAVVTLATGAGAGTDLWFVRPSAVVAVAIGVVGTPVLARRRRRVRARMRRAG